MHYQLINDLAWLEGSILSIASSDGYCSFILFDGEFGNYYNID